MKNDFIAKVGINIGDIASDKFTAPFESGLEYNPPTRGVWNIVHTGMLIPRSRQIFVCARGCLRGVILTAAEMNAADRMSWVALSERDLFDGTMEQDVIDGVTDIIKRLCDKGDKPKCVLLFLSCVHFFAGCDFKMIVEELSTAFPDIHFIDCYMTPTMRKTISPDAQMRKQLYEPLYKLTDVKKNPKAAAIIGCDRATDFDSELVRIINSAGFELMDITKCQSYDEYLKMAESSLNITYIPTAKGAGDELERRLGTKHLYLPLCWGYDEITDNYHKLCKALCIAPPDLSADKARAEKALANALSAVGQTAIAVDYTAAPRPLGLCKLLLENGFNVKRCYADSFSDEEKADFEWLKEHFPKLEILPTVNVQMEFAENQSGENYLAIGQKAAFYCQTDNFVDIVAGDGGYGFEGISKLCGLMADAFENKKDRRTVIQHKGWGCESCL